MNVWLSIVLQLLPDMRYYSIGLGCDRGTPLLTVQTALKQALQLISAQESQIRCVATIDLKVDEFAFIELAKHLGLALQCYPALALAKVPVANPSMTVLKYVGTPSVSEAAALLGAGYQPAMNPQEPTQTVPALVLEKYKHQGVCGKNVTISIAEISS
ncbi:cobalamin biosynthesis protein [Undibacterium sp. SXout11W]|uniref:cobalamin biosynthesis protein n=1 Tax=Undibacterium sp. SXout11W TaxID=3413050 RepID=UPI003BF18EB4